MVHYAILMAGLAAALPLNINLGAYSPALVVGDGEISFGGEQDVSNLMNVLEGAAVNTAASVASNANGKADAKANANANANANAEATTKPTTTTSATPAATSAQAVSAAADPSLAEQAVQIAKLQGMGKEIAPRTIDTKADHPKRDLSGFDRALTYAETALTKGPKIELGTGEGGSGVGITVDNGVSTAGKKREESAGVSAAVPVRRRKVTTMYVRSGLGAQSKRDNAGDAKPVVSPAKPAVRRDAIDSLNLNVDGDQGLTMTFVEELED